jgi:phosphoglycolate phosphatase
MELASTEKQREPGRPVDLLEAVCFDLDGTLIDHFTAIHLSINAAERGKGLPLSSYARVRSVVGGSIPVTVRRLHPDYGDLPGLLEAIEEAYPDFCYEGLRVLDGTEDLLGDLQEAGVQTAVFTNKIGDDARDVLRQCGLASEIDLIIGTRDTPWAKPDPRFAAWVLGRLGVGPGEALLVGDSPFDLEAAQSVGMPAILVATGTHSAAELTEAGAPEVVADMRAVRDQLFGRAEALSPEAT